MTLHNLKQLIPAYAKDQLRNLDVLIASTVLTDQQKWGCFLVAAATSSNDDLLKYIDTEAKKHLTADAKSVALACATAMTLNNYGFRAKHWLGQDFDDLRFGLRNTVSLKPGASQADYELWAIAVSTVNGCEQCLQAHSREAQAHGLEPAQIWQAVQIAAVTQSIAHTLRVHDALGQQDDGF